MAESFFMPGEVEDTPLEEAVKLVDRPLSFVDIEVGHREAHADGSAEFCLSFTIPDADPEILLAMLAHRLRHASDELLRAQHSQQQRRASA